MSVGPLESGITATHIRNIESTCKTVNTFLFVRPSTAETMKLIDEGYATKSMDIHDKSSDWGPHSGFVPCDQAFSKKLKGALNTNPDYHEHGEAKPVHLRLTETLTKGPKLTPVVKPGANDPNKKFVKAAGGGAGAKGLTFELRKVAGGWDVYWLNNNQAIPLYVWGYKAGGGIKPVTGDYDLWMVAPHIDRWSQHSQIGGIKDSHGESGASAFITWLLKKLNDDCNRSDNHVFHHGAEAQNYGFTQAIDRRLAMFTPAGTSQMVSADDLPMILVDAQTAGYLVYWNKRYGESDPRLAGQAVNAGVADNDPGNGRPNADAMLGPFAELAKKMFGNTFSDSSTEKLIKEAGSVNVGQMKVGNSPISFDDPKAKALIQKNLLGRGGEVPQIKQIQSFHAALQQGMKHSEKLRQGGTLIHLRVNKSAGDGGHIPESVMKRMAGDMEGLKVQKRLQEAMVNLSEMDYGARIIKKEGVADKMQSVTLAPSPEKWKAWVSKNADLFQQLGVRYGNKGPVPMSFERIPGTRAYKATPKG